MGRVWHILPFFKTYSALLHCFCNPPYFTSRTTYFAQNSAQFLVQSIVMHDILVAVVVHLMEAST